MKNGQLESLPADAVCPRERARRSRARDAYSAFHHYSIGNQILAMVQCQMRGLEPGPINTFPGWQALGRNLKRGERALILCSVHCWHLHHNKGMCRHTIASLRHVGRSRSTSLRC